MTVIFLGVDPGKSGGFAVLRPSLMDENRIGAVKMHETYKDMWSFVSDISMKGQVHAALEDIRKVYIPGVGAKSHRVLGESYGSICMALTAAEIPFYNVSPVQWQRDLHLISKKGEAPKEKKKRHKARAQELFPELTVTHAVADALLLAEWCRLHATSPESVQG